eukprot:5661282-Prymnesium_polylepis.1
MRNAETRCAALRAARPRLNESTSVGGLSPPAPSFRSDMHRRDRSPPLHAHRSALCAPGRPARLCRLDFPPLLAFGCAAAARDCSRVARRRSRRSRGYVVAAGARRPSAPTREQIVKKSRSRASTSAPPQRRLAMAVSAA